MRSFDFLDIKKISHYLLIFAVSLVCGSIVKDVMAVAVLALLGYFIITNNLYRTIEVFFVWFFIYNFYVGQGYLSIPFFSKYLVKPAFLLFVIFIFNLNRIPSKLFKSRFLIFWGICLLLALIGLVTQGQSPFVIITESSFFLIFLLLQAKGLKIVQYRNFLNLLIAVAVLQTIVSFFQVTGFISPSSKMMGDGTGANFEWVAGLDDVACGTFGPVSGHLVSWYAAIISLFLLLTWVKTRKKAYLFLLLFVLLQFATVDSKTIMGVAIAMYAYVLYRILRYSKFFNINFQKYFLLLFIIATIGFTIYTGLNTYYEYYSQKARISKRANLSAVFQGEVTTSFDNVLNNISDWGKIRGFQYIFEDFLKTPSQYIWGYGLQGYEFNGKMGYIENKDTPLMKFNNITRSRSGLITHFATTGIIGFSLLILSFVYWFKWNYRANNKFYILDNTFLKAGLLFSVFASFLYPITVTTIPVIIFSAIISILSQKKKRELRYAILLKKIKPSEI